MGHVQVANLTLDFFEIAMQQYLPPCPWEGSHLALYSLFGD